MENTNSSQRKILIVDDDPDILKIVYQCLQWNVSYTSKISSSGKGALELIDNWKPDLVLLDIDIPEISGLDILKIIKGKNQYIPTIFLSSKSKIEDIIYGLDSGADDYICKPFDIQELLARIRSQLRIKELQEELRKANKKLKRLAHTDDLTGLFNMRSLYERLDHEINRAKRFQRSVCVLMMDMDYFKSVNDQNDHLFGSYVLSEVGAILRQNIREIDLAARYGGDEFLVILTEVDQQGSIGFAERIRTVVEGKSFSHKGFSQKLTVSIGLAFFNYKDSDIDARQLIRLADHALYEAKSTGRNCIRIYNKNRQLKRRKIFKGA